MKSLKTFLPIALLSFLFAACAGLSKDEQKRLASEIASNEVIAETLQETVQMELAEVNRELSNYWTANREPDNSLYVGRGVHVYADDYNMIFEEFKKQAIESMSAVVSLLTIQDLNGDYLSMFRGSYTDYESGDDSYSDLKAGHRYYNDNFCEQFFTYKYGIFPNRDAGKTLKSLACYFDGRAVIKNGIPEIAGLERVKVSGIQMCWKVKVRSSGHYYVSLFKDFNGKWTGIAHKDTPEFDWAKMSNEMYDGGVGVSEKNSCSVEENDDDRPPYAAEGTFDNFIYLTAQNSRGFCISYPSFLSCRYLSENGDGIMMDYDGRNYLEAYGEWNTMDETIDELFAEELKSPMGDITYKVKRDKWFVVSGYMPDGRIFYKRTALTDEGAIATADMVFEKRYEQYFKPTIARIFNNFPN